MIYIKKPSKHIALHALVFSISIELSQLYHASWIDTLRYTRIGGLVLRYVFMWSDIVCYVLGITLGCFSEIIKKRLMSEKECY